MSDTNGTAPPLPSDRVQAILNEFIANYYGMRRESLGRALFDPRRDVEDEAGLTRLGERIDQEEYQRFYERDPLAAKVVELYPKECFQTSPSVYEVEDGDEATPFEQAVDDLSRSNYGLKSYYQDEEGSPIVAGWKKLDILCGVGHYGIGLLGLDDELPLHEPARPRPGQKLTFFRQFPEYQAVVTRWDNDVKSPRHSQPLTYNVTLNDPREDIQTGQGISVGTHTVHWTRVIHVADSWHQATSSEVYSPPRMRCVWNQLCGLHKIYAGDPEAYWKNSLMKLFFGTHPQLGGDVKINRQRVKDELEPFLNGTEQAMLLSGLNAQVIAPVVADPTPHLAVQIEAICIKLGCPVRIFKGSERGELASSQDDDAWNDRLKERQQSFITPKIICPFIDRLIWLGVLPAPSGYSVYWPDLKSQSESEKATIAATKVGALVQYVGGNGESVLPPHNLLQWLGEDDESASAILDEATEAVGDDEETPGLPEVPDEDEPVDQAEYDEDDLDDNCGGKGGKPGPCQDKGAAAKAKVPAKKAASKPAAKPAAAKPAASKPKAAKPPAAKVKAPADKVAAINAKIAEHKQKLTELKGELKAAKLEASSVKAAAKGALQKEVAGKGPTKADVAAKESASKVQAISDRHAATAGAQVDRIVKSDDLTQKIPNMVDGEKVKAEVKAAVGKSSPHKIAREMGIKQKFKSSAEAYRAIEQKVTGRVGMIYRQLA